MDCRSAPVALELRVAARQVSRAPLKETRPMTMAIIAFMSSHSGRPKRLRVLSGGGDPKAPWPVAVAAGPRPGPGPGGADGGGCGGGGGAGGGWRRGGGGGGGG